MAQSRFSQHSPDLLDTVSAWEAFEHINSVSLKVRLASVTVRGRWKLMMVGEVWSLSVENGEALLLVSESLNCSDTSWRSMDTAVFRLIYALDAALAFKELGVEKPK